MKYYGKEKCRILKEIRAEIARQNDIEWLVEECQHKGNCKGTCPKCEYEVRKLEAALARREALGKKVAVVGISASLALSVTGCVNPFPSVTDGVPMGDPLPSDTEEATACDTAIQGEEVQTETGDLVIPGEPLPDTEEPLMGDVVFEGEVIEETVTWDESELMGAPVEMPTEIESDTETDSNPIGEGTTASDSDDEDWGVTAGEPLPDDEDWNMPTDSAEE